MRPTAAISHADQSHYRRSGGLLVAIRREGRASSRTTVLYGFQTPLWRLPVGISELNNLLSDPHYKWHWRVAGFLVAVIGVKG
jgi:hypothetical protein